MYEVQKCKLHPQKLNNYQILYHITDKAIYLINICYVCYIHKKMLDLKKNRYFYLFNWQHYLYDAILCYY